MKNNLLETFNITKANKKQILTDYEIFPDKKLLDDLRNRIIENIIDKQKEEKITTEIINQEIESMTGGYDLTNLEKSHLYNLVDNEINGFGPLTEVLNDDNISEIMVNGSNEVYIEIDGKIIKDESVSFINDEHILRTLKRLIQPTGKTIDITNPIVDCRIVGGHRINGIIPPLSAKGPIFTIRKFLKNNSNIEDWIRMGSLTPYMARFLQASIMGRLNILICGSSGVGKTSLLNILSDFIQNNERVITIEEAIELDLKQPNVISLETRSGTYNKENKVTIRDLVISSLLMRPDRIIIGEVRGKEAFDMLQAMNTGHDGSMSTIHANSPMDALNRLETMVLMGEIKIPIKAIREYISSAIDIVVHIKRMSDGKRKITQICEVVGMEGDRIKLNNIFEFRQFGLTNKNEVNGEYALIEKVPEVYQKLKSRGVDIVDDMFESFEQKKPIVQPNPISKHEEPISKINPVLEEKRLFRSREDLLKELPHLK